MSDQYGIDAKTRFLVLHLDAHMSGADISRIIRKTKQTVSKWVKLTKQGRDIRTEGKGRRRTITEETENKVIQMVKENPEKVTLKKLAASVGHAQSAIGKILAKRGFKFKPLDQSRIYEEEERAIRVDFCKKMLDEDGKLIYRTFFSDEMGMELNKTHKKKAWQISTEKLRKKNLLANIKLDCWGAISAQGATSLEIYKKGTNGKLYRRIIESHKTEFEALYPDGEFYFIQDYHPVHRMNEDWIVQEQKIRLIKLPRRSPDLNIIEVLWVAMKKKIATDGPTSEKELRESLLRNWEILTKPERLQAFFESLHSRYLVCIAKDGQRVI